MSFDNPEQSISVTSAEHGGVPIQPLPRMTDHQAAVILEVAGLETKATVLASFDVGEQATASEINETMLAVQGNRPLWTPADSYYPGICSQFSHPKYAIFARGETDSIDSVHTYTLLPLGGLARGLGGQLLRWGQQSGLALRNTLGEANAFNTPSMLTRFAVLATAVQEGVINPREMAREHQDFDSRILRTHCLRLAELGIFEDWHTKAGLVKGHKQSGAFVVTERHTKNAANLVEIFRDMALFDSDFYLEGNQLATEILQNPVITRKLIRRVGVTSERTNGRRINFRSLCDSTVAFIEDSGSMLTSKDLLERFASTFTPQARYRYLRLLKSEARIGHAGPGNGEYVFFATQPDSEAAMAQTKTD